MQKFNSLYVCPLYFTLKGQGNRSNITPFGAIVTISVEDINIGLYNGDILKLDVSTKHPDVKPLFYEYERRITTACDYDSYDNRNKRSYSHKKLVTLKSEVDKARNKYVRRGVIVCRRELRSLTKQLDQYRSRLNE